MSKLTTHFKSYSQAINFITLQMEETESLFRECVKAGRIDKAEELIKIRNEWIALLADNLKKLNEPANKIFESLEDNVREDHAVAVYNKLS